MWEVCFELGDALAPVCGGLLADQLDVEEGALAWAEHGARCRASHDSWRDVRDQILC